MAGMTLLAKIEMIWIVVGMACVAVVVIATLLWLNGRIPKE